MNSPNLNNILIVQLGFLGDVVLSTPVITALKSTFPNASIDILCTKEASGLLTNHPLISNVLTYDKRKSESGVTGLLKKAKELRKKEYDAVFSLHKSYRTALLLWFARIPLRFGFINSAFKFLYTKCAIRKDLSHDVERNLAILRNIGIDPIAHRTPLSIGLTEQLRQEASSTLSRLPAKKVAIAPGSVWRTKRWTKEGFSDLARALLSSGYGVVLIGGPSDKDTGVFIESQIDTSQLSPVLKNNLINTIGTMKLDASAALIEQCDVLVTNDSAPLHLGSALGIPTVAIFCATVPEQGFGPWMVEHKIVEKKSLACRPCGSHGGNTCPLNTDACQKDIKFAEVLAAVNSLVGARSNNACQ